MATNKLAKELREAMYMFGKNQVLKAKCEERIKHHDMMFLTGILSISSQKDGLVKMIDISNRFNISAAAISQIIRKFENNGYVERVHFDNDRRSVYIRLTDTVIAEMETTNQQFDEKLTQLITFLGEEDSKNLIRIMKRTGEFHLDENKK